MISTLDTLAVPHLLPITYRVIVTAVMRFPVQFAHVQYAGAQFPAVKSDLVQFARVRPQGVRFGG